MKKQFKIGKELYKMLENVKEKIKSLIMEEWSKQNNLNDNYSSVLKNEFIHVLFIGLCKQF